MKPSVLLVTANETKSHWMRQGLARLTIPIRTLDGKTLLHVEENGSSCEENAWIKARSVPMQQNTVIVAEDSGLFVDVLGGQPGTHTSRWAPGTDDDRVRRLLELLEDVPSDRRTAHFLSAVAIRFPDGQEVTVRGELEGKIGGKAGPEGTGYGGVFELANGQLLYEKTGIGEHRLRALEAATNEILAWQANGRTMSKS